MQETLLRAWRGRDRFDGGGAVPGVAVPHRHQRVPRPAAASGRAACAAVTLVRRGAVAAALPRPAPRRDRRRPGDEPDAVVVDRETIELAFLAALQVLPPRQRAALLAARRARLAGERDRRRSSTRAWPRRTARCSGRGRRCRSTSRAARGVVDGRAQRRGTGAARAVHRRARALRRRGRGRHRRARTSASRMPPNPLLLRGARRGRAAPAAGASARSATATGGWCRRWPNRMPAAGELPAPARRHRVPGVQARRAAHPRTAPSPRSRPSARPSSPSSDCPTRSDAGGP